jgi:hypothetical protein
MPVDWGVSFYVDVAADTGLAGESNFLAWVAEDFQSEQGVQPLPETFKNAAGRSVFLALTEDDAAAAALSETHAVHIFMRTFVNLHTVLQSDLRRFSPAATSTVSFSLTNLTWGMVIRPFEAMVGTTAADDRDAILALESQ